MIDLHIKSVGFASLMLQTEKVDALVSIGNPGSKLPDGIKRAPFRLRLEMEDLYELKDLHKYHSQGRRCPNLEDVEGIVEFARKLKGDECLLVHCHSGISRSSAAAWIILYVRNGPGSEQASLDEVLQVRLAAWPNKIMMAYADELLQANFLETMNTSSGGIWLL